jgi:hypothetical protein
MKATAKSWPSAWQKGCAPCSRRVKRCTSSCMARWVRARPPSCATCCARWGCRAASRAPPMRWWSRTKPGAGQISHFDFYRFNDPREWEDAGFRDLFAAPGLKLAEWPEQAQGLLPVPDLRLSLTRWTDTRRARCAAGPHPHGRGLAPKDCPAGMSQTASQRPPASCCSMGSLVLWPGRVRLAWGAHHGGRARVAGRRTTPASRWRATRP